ncbi:hypothetical protein [Amycolatopsis sp. H20-H5]|uniref:hypothetical protein n=1 Tax=Amycolatopsis sp. H20-H5 TaxID=3046309 RepID=UPI002DB7BE18|nr:hypothetical protein [Amycolatopsis sp. H20-H5]MEC3980750.1 hypothetical protein [Amycolatopsis sp. H20-H5]
MPNTPWNSRLLRRDHDEHQPIVDGYAGTAMWCHIRSSAEAMARWIEDQHTP